MFERYLQRFVFMFFTLFMFVVCCDFNLDLCVNAVFNGVFYLDLCAFGFVATFVHWLQICKMIAAIFGTWMNVVHGKFSHILDWFATCGTYRFVITRNNQQTKHQF